MLTLIYKVPNKKVALLEFEKFKERWSEYPVAIKICVYCILKIPIHQIVIYKNKLENLDSVINDIGTSLILVFL